MPVHWYSRYPANTIGSQLYYHNTHKNTDMYKKSFELKIACWSDLSNLFRLFKMSIGLHQTFSRANDIWSHTGQICWILKNLQILLKNPSVRNERLKFIFKKVPHQFECIFARRLLLKDGEVKSYVGHDSKTTFFFVSIASIFISSVKAKWKWMP